jgi:hypothetical protein
VMSARVKAFLDAHPALMKGNEALRVELRDPQDRPLHGAFFMLRQLHVPACLDEARTAGARWPDPSQGYVSVERLALDAARVPADVHFFRAAQFPQLLLVSEEVVRGFIAAGFVGLNYMPVDAWTDVEVRWTAGPLVIGPRPSEPPPAKPRKAAPPPKRTVPAAVRALVKEYGGGWVVLGGKGSWANLHAWLFDWEALSPAERQKFEEDYLAGTSAEAATFTPFAILHHDPAALGQELGRKTKKVSDLLRVQTDGLLIGADSGAVFFLDEGSREEVAKAPRQLKLRRT